MAIFSVFFFLFWTLVNRRQVASERLRGSWARGWEGLGRAMARKLCMNQINFMDRIKKRKEWRLAVRAATRKTGHFLLPLFLSRSPSLRLLVPSTTLALVRLFFDLLVCSHSLARSLSPFPRPVCNRRSCSFVLWLTHLLSLARSLVRSLFPLPFAVSPHLLRSRVNRVCFPFIFLYAFFFFFLLPYLLFFLLPHLFL